MDELTIRPIGYFHSRRKHSYEAPRQTEDHRPDDGVIELLAGSQFEQALDGIDSFERLWVIFQFHQNNHWKPMVRPPRGSSRKRGVFATRAPYRPNPLGLSCVKLLRREGLKLWIEGSDLLDGTPILDLKPYLATADSFPEAKAGWLEGVEDTRHQVAWSPHASQQLEWLRSRGVTNLQDFAEQQLEFEPLDDERKRVRRIDTNKAALAYRTWRIYFSWEDLKITIDFLETGYAHEELLATEDRWGDKALHREFAAAFPNKTQGRAP